MCSARMSPLAVRTRRPPLMSSNEESLETPSNLTLEPFGTRILRSEPSPQPADLRGISTSIRVTFPLTSKTNASVRSSSSPSTCTRSSSHPKTLTSPRGLIISTRPFAVASLVSSTFSPAPALLATEIAAMKTTEEILLILMT